MPSSGPPMHPERSISSRRLLGLASPSDDAVHGECDRPGRATKKRWHLYSHRNNGAYWQWSPQESGVGCRTLNGPDPRIGWSPHVSASSETDTDTAPRTQDRGGLGGVRRFGFLSADSRLDLESQLTESLCAALGEQSTSTRMALGLEWTEVDWSGLEWTGVDWSGLEWTGVDRHAVPLVRCIALPRFGAGGEGQLLDRAILYTPGRFSPRPNQVQSAQDCAADKRKRAATQLLDNLVGHTAVGRQSTPRAAQQYGLPWEMLFCTPSPPEDDSTRRGAAHGSHGMGTGDRSGHDGFTAVERGRSSGARHRTLGLYRPDIFGIVLPVAGGWWMVAGDWWLVTGGW
ncbi:hypothetical protein B2J93_3870 [Marssonina coronariae]|uniref:Uncharacterized protein n=1 Tax=Diplocarpon coronariae TaxID=2795749 RepID=A0A218ZGH8_9HELO|nr:hypothetical protein B2J93_3870 [Marssonina coronariae]